MTVKDLIDQLNKQPLNLPVHIGGQSGIIKTVAKCDYTTGTAKKIKSVIVLTGATK